MAKTRPYYVKLKGQKPQMVEAISREQAVDHVVKPLLEDVHAASAGDVVKFCREGGTVAEAGVYPEEKEEGGGLLGKLVTGDAPPPNDERAPDGC